MRSHSSSFLSRFRKWTRRQAWLRADSRPTAGFLILAGILVSQASLAAAQHDESSRFRYVGGTENVRYDCVGTLQIGEDALTFKCESSQVRIPYRDIETMQYRADVTRRIRRMKVRWTAIPPEHTGGGKNIYFILVYRTAGLTHVLIFHIPEDQMRPYLAEIDLKVGRRVEVQSHENYSP